jgi:hypothetical protein
LQKYFVHDLELSPIDDEATYLTFVGVLDGVDEKDIRRQLRVKYTTELRERAVEFVKDSFDEEDPDPDNKTLSRLQ